METTKVSATATLEGERRDLNDALAAMDALVAQMYRRPVGEGLAAYFAEVDADDTDDIFMADERCGHGVELIKAHFAADDTPPGAA